eukprot:2885149-Amphidinium_carterae.1
MSLDCGLHRETGLEIMFDTGTKFKLWAMLHQERMLVLTLKATCFRNLGVMSPPSTIPSKTNE